MTEQKLYNCPDCPCFFFTQSDLNKHLAKFGEIHAQALREVHHITDNSYTTSEFSEADKTVSDFEKAIKEYYGIGAPKR